MFPETGDKTLFHFCTISNGGKFIVVESREGSVFLIIQFNQCPSIDEMSIASFLWKF